MSGLSSASQGSGLITLLIGGRHVGGNITPEDIANLADLLNSTNHQLPTTNSFMISTSRRTEAATVAAIRRHFKVSHCEELCDEAIQRIELPQTGLPRRPGDLLAMTENILYDFNTGSNIGNPYLDFMAASDGIIVSGDSVRMVSEACSSGKMVWIWNPPSTKFNPYAKLHENLVAIGAARIFTGNLTLYTPNTLREADRIAAIIRAQGWCGGCAQT
jgi:mitochondrial fission protein ELM1